MVIEHICFERGFLMEFIKTLLSKMSLWEKVDFAECDLFKEAIKPSITPFKKMDLPVGAAC